MECQLKIGTCFFGVKQNKQPKMNCIFVYVVLVVLIIGLSIGLFFLVRYKRRIESILNTKQDIEKGIPTKKQQTKNQVVHVPEDELDEVEEQITTVNASHIAQTQYKPQETLIEEDYRENGSKSEHRRSKSSKSEKKTKKDKKDKKHKRHDQYDDSTFT